MRRFDAGLSGVGCLWTVLGDEQHEVHRRHPGLLHADRHLCPLHVERTVRSDSARLQYDDTPLSGLCQRRGVRRVDPGL
jgi:hypothetical protein